MTIKLNLGEEVVVTGRYEESSNTVVSDRFNKVRITERYKLNRFQEARRGFIVGRRSIVKNLIHKLRGNTDLDCSEEFLFNYDNWDTSIYERETVYLVACDMRGLMYVPESEIIPEDLIGEAIVGLQLFEGLSDGEIERLFSGV